MTSMQRLIGIGVLAVCAAAQDLPRRGAIGLVIAAGDGGAVPEMSHDLHRWASPEEYLRRSRTSAEHPFQEGLFAVMMPWLEKLV